MSSSTPSICVVVVFSRTNHRSGSGSGALRSPSHKRFTGTCSLRSHIVRFSSSPPYLPSSHPLVSSFPLTSATWIPNLDPFSSCLSIPLTLSFLRPCLSKLGSSTQAVAYAIVRLSMKNSSRAKCRGFACGGGKPGFWHVCSDCGKRFCPKCVRPRSRHACVPMVPPAEPPTDESDLRTNESTGISRSEL